jgi:hypothetical protein
MPEAVRAVSDGQRQVTGTGFAVSLAVPFAAPVSVPLGAVNVNVPLMTKAFVPKSTQVSTTNFALGPRVMFTVVMYR